MKVEVVTPEDYVGNVIGDLNGRRGQIQGQEAAASPSSSTRWCRSPTCSSTSTICARCRQGRAQYTMQFDHYEPVPTAVAQEVQKKYA